MSKQNKYILFDGNNIASIAFHRAKSIVYEDISERVGVKPRQIEPDKHLNEEDNHKIKGMMFHVYFLKIHKIFKRFKNARYIVTWDAYKASGWRKKVFPEYKSNRDYSDPTSKIFFDGMKEIKGILKSYPVFQVEMENLEADDIIYQYSKVLHENSQVVIVSTDSDLQQIAQQFDVKIFNPLKQKFCSIPTTYDICVYKSIDGEKGDGIPGIKGYGKKKSQKLAEEMFKDPAALYQLERPQIDIFKRNYELIDISNNPHLEDITVDLEEIEKSTNSIDTPKIRKFYFDNKLRQLLETFEYVEDIIDC